MSEGQAQIDAIFAENPLVRFSVFTHMQVHAVADLGREIEVELDEFISPERRVEHARFQRTYTKFWMWTLAAYEVVRTMRQHRRCFASDYAVGIDQAHEAVADLRVAFAKQEVRGRRGKIVYGEPSVSSIDMDRGDFGFSIGGRTIWMRETISGWARHVLDVKPEDVLQDMREV